jgi:hypothetical protein
VQNTQKGDIMAIVSFRREEIPPMTEERKEELRALAERPDSEIDFSDIPRITDFSGFMTMEEVKAYRAARKAQAETI